MNARALYLVRATIHHGGLLVSKSRTRCIASSASVATAEKPRFVASVLSWYSRKLDTHPLLTKAITSGLVGGAGDLICQSIVDKSEKESLRQVITDKDLSLWWWWDGWRTARFCFLGTVFVAPLCHYWYGALAFWYPLGAANAATSNAMMVVKRVALDQLVFSPVLVCCWISSLWTLENGIMSGNTAVDTVRKENSEIPARLIETVPGVMVANWIFWIPVQVINFRFVPTKFQVLTANCVALIWNAYLSFSTRTKPAIEV